MERKDTYPQQRDQGIGPSLKGARRGEKLQCPLEGTTHLSMPAEAQTQEGPAGGEADWGPWHQHASYYRESSSSGGAEGVGLAPGEQGVTHLLPAARSTLSGRCSRNNRNNLPFDRQELYQIDVN